MAEGTRETTKSDEDLSKLQDTIEQDKGQETEKVVSETEEAKEEKVEAKPEDKSEIGRRASKRIHERLDGMDSNFKQIMDKLSVFQPQSNASEFQTSQGEDDFISTRGDVEKILEAREAKATKAKEQYNESYLKVIDSLADEEGLGDEAIKEMEVLLTKSFNKSYSDFKDPIADADRNFQRALRAYDKSNTKSSPLNGGDATGAGGIGGTKMTDKDLPEPKLSEDAQGFVAHLKKEGSDLAKPENLAKTLQGKAPVRLRKPIDRK